MENLSEMSEQIQKRVTLLETSAVENRKRNERNERKPLCFLEDLEKRIENKEGASNNPRPEQSEENFEEHVPKLQDVKDQTENVEEAATEAPPEESNAPQDEEAKPKREKAEDRYSRLRDNCRVEAKKKVTEAAANSVERTSVPEKFEVIGVFDPRTLKVGLSGRTQWSVSSARTDTSRLLVPLSQLLHTEDKV
ncbi:hypothetical protein L596_009511 [Steinernema carpocapsae]|uniref:Uncharacterized protein n=1 Tax=Steinernema carpocapsae TaxID=34508 RepID=A0A4U5PFK0_STECR|nr:hypothetical protein L596_009511 [Steinernema carpocapsae]